MEAFSMFKYWKGGGGGGGGGGGLGSKMRATPTTISTYPVSPTAESEEHNDDEGPFFDIEFALPDEENRDGEEEEEEEEEDEEKGEREFDFELSSTGSGGPTEPSLSLSPSDDLFFKGRLVPFEPFNSSEPNSKPQFPISLLKSATKFRVFLLGSRKPPPPKSESETPDASSAQKQQPQSKLFTVKFKVEEVPIVSLFTRDNSSRSSSSGTAKPQKQMSEESVSDEGGVASSRSSKDVLHKYLKMIKPLYVRASKRYGEKLKFSGQLSLGVGEPAIDEGREEVGGGGGGGGGESASTANILKNKQVNVPAGLRVVGKYLGKSRSASAAVGCVPPAGLQSRRRDDSLLQQQDGIQGAILHCKRSFNACKDSERNFTITREAEEKGKKLL